MQQRAGSDGEAHSRYDQTGARRKASGDSLHERVDPELEYLDIPAFLRRQAE